MRQRYTWNKAEKLKSRKRIDQVFKRGRNFSLFPFKVFYVVTPVAPAAPPEPSGAPPTQAAASPIQTAAPPIQTAAHGQAAPKLPAALVQAGFGAGSRHFKKAVDRNRIKRLCREAYRLQKQPLVDHLAARGLTLAVFFVYIGKDLPDYQTITGKIGVILRKLVKETA
ncbi:MAG TPA: ribonuclease P protein component [Puia sp.]|nr:ribonuclease P protein component [Puia sp.]